MQKNAAHANKNTSDHHKLLFHGDDENENCKTKHRLKKIAVLGASASEFRCKFFQHWELSLLSSSSPITAHSVCKPALSWKYLMVLITCITFFSPPLSLSIASFHFNLFFCFRCNSKNLLIQLALELNFSSEFFLWLYIIFPLSPSILCTAHELFESQIRSQQGLERFFFRETCPSGCTWWRLFSAIIAACTGPARRKNEKQNYHSNNHIKILSEPFLINSSRACKANHSILTVQRLEMIWKCFAAIGCFVCVSWKNFHGNPKRYFFIDVYSRGSRRAHSLSLPLALSHTASQHLAIPFDFDSRNDSRLTRWVCRKADSLLPVTFSLNVSRF